MPSTWTGRGGLALGLSLALHALLVIGLRQFSGGGAACGDDEPARVVMVLDDGEEEQEAPPVANASPVDSGNQSPADVASSIRSMSQDPLGAEPVHFEGSMFGSDANLAGQSGAGSVNLGNGTSFCGVRARGQRIVYVVDRSASMGENGALQFAARELLASLDQMPAGAQFQVIVYNRHPQALLGNAGPWLTTSEEIKARLAAALDHLAAEGGTEHLPALRRALNLHPDVIYFLTDADDLSPQQQREITSLNHGSAIIHTIELTLAHRDRPDMPLQVLARANRGQYQAVQLTPAP